MILAAARIQNRICVTLDHDFHSHLATAGQGRPSVILLRIQGLAAEQQAELIGSICRTCYDLLIEGAAISSDWPSLRVRRLPLK